MILFHKAGLVNVRDYMYTILHTCILLYKSGTCILKEHG